MGLSTTSRNVLESYRNKLQKDRSGNSSCFFPSFFSFMSQRKATKIDALNHILDHGGCKSAEDLRKDLKQEQFNGWDAGFWSNTKTKIDNALKLMEYNSKKTKYTENDGNSCGNNTILDNSL